MEEDIGDDVIIMMTSLRVIRTLTSESPPAAFTRRESVDKLLCSVSVHDKNSNKNAIAH